MEARVGVSSHGGAVVDGGARKFLQSHHHHHQRPLVHQQDQIGTVPQLLAGGIAGAFSKTCTAPLARLTILFQVQGMHSDAAALSKSSIWHEALRIVNEEGFRAFWKGNLVTIAHRLPYSAVNFYAYEHYKSVIVKINSRSRKSQEKHKCRYFCAFCWWWVSRYDSSLFHISIGSCQDTTCCTACTGRLSGSLVKRSTIYYQGLWHALHTICRDEGFFGLYKGLGATLLGVGPSIAISFSVYEALRSYWHSQRCALLRLELGLTILLPLLALPVAVFLALHHQQILSRAVVIRLICWITTFPLDLVRRRKQLEGVAGQARVYKTGIFGTFKHIMRTEGLRGLYRGILPEYYKVVPGVGIVFMTYETLKKLLSHGPFDS
ncbi:hypothetical protein RHGRI_011780 [Rhododendron griersonianum]|uniref:Mitochondrial substrate carrier family protein n=1 Tax=Rhododendron griersonianum TaxID=479676 RepID=A0AAV6KPC3_9ERIC|nr:hypothetical protein RHGRI_011780 [Rhododendron griersonianum]